MHIAEQVAAELIAQGFEQTGCDFRKIVRTGGVFGKATELVCMDESGRCSERVDDFGRVEKDVNLREFANDPRGAVAAVLA